MNIKYYKYEDALEELKKYKQKGFQGFVQKFYGMNDAAWYEVCIWK